MSGYWGWKKRPRVGTLQQAAKREAARMEKSGRKLSPIVVDGRTIARTFWGRAWCDNLESYGDYENRLPRGRSYLRNGLVVHLEVAAGSVEALVRGTSLYEVKIGIKPVPKTHWETMCRESAGAIDSLVELLQGRFSSGVMRRLCRQNDGLFPRPKEITFRCSCPDWASMCKHVAAVLYGVGARLDERPELLFRLRKVDAEDLVTSAAAGAPLADGGATTEKVLTDVNISELFGLQMAAPAKKAPARKNVAKKPAAKKSAAKKAPAKKAPAKKAPSRK